KRQRGWPVSGFQHRMLWSSLVVISRDGSNGHQLMSMILAWCVSNFCDGGREGEREGVENVEGKDQKQTDCKQGGATPHNAQHNTGGAMEARRSQTSATGTL